MFEHRRKIALAVALILGMGTAAASVANYVSGNGAAPSVEGANAAFDMAMDMAGKSTDWMIDRSRKVVKTAFSYAPPSQVRPPEVPFVPPATPMVQRGPYTPVQIDPWLPYGSVAGRNGAPSFDDGLRAAARPGGVLSLAASSAAAAADITAAVPEPEAYVLLLAGLGVMGMVARRRGKLHA